MLMDYLKRKRLALLGFGVEGFGTYQFLRQQFPGKELAIFDETSSAAFEYPADSRRMLSADPHARLILGPMAPQALDEYEVISRSAGVPGRHAALQRARERGSLITSHMEMFFEFCDPARIVGVTGTKGKSTTASLLAAILRQGGLPAALAGNIGVPPLPLLFADPRQHFVLELSSHQLESLGHSPHIAVLLDIVPEHLTYHGGFEKYVAAKENITKHQRKDDVLIYNADGRIPCEIAARSPARKVPFSISRVLPEGTSISEGTIVFKSKSEAIPVCETSQVTLPGKFNLQNVMAAATAAHLLNIGPDAIRSALAEFRPLPHRLELLGSYRGIRFFDDSISTVPESTLAALDALGPEVFTLILGGYDRGLEFHDFAVRLMKSDVGLLILFPSTGERIWNAIVAEWTGKKPLPEAVHVRTMPEAVAAAFSRTPANRICLLSPASPSFGVFKDYKDRGNQFRADIVQMARTGAMETGE
jgi:UDP-N-acetylmuramoylalanine--D-glutamate ligase